MSRGANKISSEIFTHHISIRAVISVNLIKSAGLSFVRRDCGVGVRLTGEAGEGA